MKVKQFGPNRNRGAAAVNSMGLAFIFFFQRSLSPYSKERNIGSKTLEWARCNIFAISYTSSINNKSPLGQ